MSRKPRYQFQTLRMPYTLSDAEKEAMREVYREVMAPLHFAAVQGFIENLFNTDILVRIFAPGGELAGFGNIKLRHCGGHLVRHIFTSYVSPRHRGHGLSSRAISHALRGEIWRNGLCLREPLYVTGSSVNPMVVHALARRVPTWPDLLGGGVPPAEVRAIAEETATRFYPKVGEKPFQVAITPELAILRSNAGEIQRTGDPDFDARFFELADPDALTLLLFVARVRFRDLLSLALGLKRGPRRRGTSSSAGATPLPENPHAHSGDVHARQQYALD